MTPSQTPPLVPPDAPGQPSTSISFVDPSGSFPTARAFEKDGLPLALGNRALEHPDGAGRSRRRGGEPSRAAGAGMARAGAWTQQQPQGLT